MTEIDDDLASTLKFIEERTAAFMQAITDNKTTSNPTPYDIIEHSQLIAIDEISRLRAAIEEREQA